SRRGVTTELNNEQQFSSVRVRNGAVLGPTAGQALCLVVSGDATVESGGLIGADTKGFGAGAGPGGRPAVSGGGGAGHGGEGGDGQSQPGGLSYGDIRTPTTLGSGAGGLGGG